MVSYSAAIVNVTSMTQPREIVDTSQGGTLDLSPVDHFGNLVIQENVDVMDYRTYSDGEPASIDLQAHLKEHDQRLAVQEVDIGELKALLNQYTLARQGVAHLNLSDPTVEYEIPIIPS